MLPMWCDCGQKRNFRLINYWLFYHHRGEKKMTRKGHKSFEQFSFATACCFMITAHHATVHIFFCEIIYDDDEEEQRRRPVGCDRRQNFISTYHQVWTTCYCRLISCSFPHAALFHKFARYETMRMRHLQVMQEGEKERREWEVMMAFVNHHPKKNM